MTVRGFDRASTAAGAAGTYRVAGYDGSAGTIVDTNVWVDCIDERSPWHDRAIDRLQACAERTRLHINVGIYTELLVPRPDAPALDEMLDLDEVVRSPLPWACAALTARAWGLYRERGGAKTGPMPDLYIGAHAAVADLSVLTRDRAGHASYFPKLSCS